MDEKEKSNKKKEINDYRGKSKEETLHIIGEISRNINKQFEKNEEKEEER